MRKLVLAGVVALAAATAQPAVAASPGCVSADLRCQSYRCPTGWTAVFHNGWHDTGPWIVVCAPAKA